ncbi:MULTISPECIES: ATP-binding protein [unclassified Leptolyngbya]|uniref:ATP-binding protein n=1 Tax=unclassified Leptolyngbya TaxID=2650499 RepID=UPI00168882F5|nr:MULTISPECIES: ATP-binding protein [unclassified Leptolyngbya]MBD1909367.1 response regulator [Leptolyngbya sp. FACHB-8]MBD2156922.1 response regulator [Leptolyngbya sp. FACHB-16]
MRDKAQIQPEDCLAGGGEMGMLMRSLDWSKTLVGPVSTWPQSLRTAVSIMLASRFPMLIHWGPEYVQFYNDGFRPILGNSKHPGALGQPAYPWWAEIWDVLVPMFDRVMAGEGTWYEDQVVFPNRYGYTEEAYFTFSHSPIRDESGQVAGIFQAVTETTERVLNERRLKTLRDLAARAVEAQMAEAACQIAAETLDENPNDIPFALLYLIDQDRNQATLAGTVGLEPDTPASPAIVQLNKDLATYDCWSITQVASTGQMVQVDNLFEKFGLLPGGLWPESPSTALVLPVAQPGSLLPTGLLVAGISPRRALNDSYQSFLTLVAGQIAIAISNTRALEQERKRASALAELDRAKSQFLANMSHELRTPLNGILGYAQILKRHKTLSDSQKNGLSVINQCGEHLLTLINDVLDISKIEARKMELHPKNFRFPEFLEGVADICQIRAKQKGIELIYEALTPLPLRIRADEKRLRQILLNLLGNAVKFTEMGSVTFKVGCVGDSQWIVDDQTSLPLKIRFQVEDTGVGIAPDQLENIFLPFQQAEGQDQQIEGTGLGLTITRQLIEMMGGEIHVKSILGQGSTFWLELELPEVDSVDELNSLNTQEIISYEGPTRRVLVVDDKWANRAVLINLLEPLGFEVVEAENGQEGLNKTQQFKPDIIFMDLVMPVMDGFEATRQLRASSNFKDNIIIATSASVFEFDQQQSLDVGCDDFLPKPVREADLLEQLRTHLKLQWIYEKQGGETDSAISASENSQMAPSSLIIPSDAIATLLDLSLRGDLKGITERLNQLELSSPQLTPFTHHLRQLVKGFKIKQIQEFIKEYKNEH